MRTDFLCISELGVASGLIVKLVDCKRAFPLPSPVVYTTDRSYVVVPGFFLVFFSPFNIAITSLREERVGPCAVRAFVCFARDGLCLSPLHLGIKDCLQLVIVELLGLFFLLVSEQLSYLRFKETRYNFKGLGSNTIKIVFFFFFFFFSFYETLIENSLQPSVLFSLNILK